MELFKIVVQVLISIGAAFLAAHLATQRLRKDKWWTMQAEAYGELIESLHTMRWAASEHHEAELIRKDVESDRSEAMWKQFSDARKEVWKIADKSSFLVSDEVLKSVQRMENGLSDANREQTYFEHLDSLNHAVDVCLGEIKEIGKKQLQIQW